MGEKYVTEQYITAVGRTFWGYFFIYFNLNLGPVDVFPGWAGYILLLTALPGIAQLEPSAALLKPFIYILVAWDVASVLVNLIGGAAIFEQLYGLTAAMAVVGLYFHFQLLTNIAQIAERQGNPRAQTFRSLRSFLTVLQTLVALVPLLGTPALLYSGINMIAVPLALVMIVLMIAIMVNLHGYKKELIAMNDTAMNSPLL